MSQYENHCNYKCESMICGNSVDVNLNDCTATQVRADIMVQEYDIINLWGQIKSNRGHLVSGAIVKLVQVNCTCNGEEYFGIAHTISDCNGFYQFEVKRADEDTKFKIIVSRAKGYSEREHCCEKPCLVEASEICDYTYAQDCESKEFDKKDDCKTICQNRYSPTTYDYSCKSHKK